MKAQMMVISNSEEIAMAKESYMKDESVIIPEKKTEYTDVLFDPNNVSISYLDTNGDIRIIYNGQDLSLKYDKEVFDELEENFKNR
jgi:hypothetical protein